MSGNDSKRVSGKIAVEPKDGLHLLVRVHDKARICREGAIPRREGKNGHNGGEKGRARERGSEVAQWSGWNMS